MKQLQNYQRQQGVVLIVALVILLIMTLLAVSSMQTTTLQSRMSANMHNKHLAFEAAEAALSDAEDYIRASVNNPGLLDATFVSPGVSGYYDNSVTEIWNVVDWKGDDVGNTNEAIDANTSIAGALQASYVIELLTTNATQAAKPDKKDVSGGFEVGSYGKSTPPSDSRLFRITARGVGAVDTSVVILQAVYNKNL